MSARRRISRLTTPARRLANPPWLAAYLRGRSRARARQSAIRNHAPTTFSIKTFAGHLRPKEVAVLEVTGATPDEYARALASAWRPQPEAGDDTPWASRTVLLEVLAAIVALTRPRVAVEVGVERGYSSAVILAGMASCSAGELHSIDLPRLRADEREFIGRVIPQELRQRWQLVLGPSRHQLPKVLKRAGTLDLFLHDADHSYESQIEDLRRAWPHLREQGIVVVDDVWSPALIDFSNEVQERALLIERWDAHDGIGLMRKSRATVR